MKKFLFLFLILLFCFISTNSFADFKGSYSLDSVTITPPAGGAVWDGANPANVVVGTTYHVEMLLAYNQKESNDDWWVNNITSTLTFNTSGLTFSDDDNAGGIEYDKDGNEWISHWDFFFDIEVTEAMLKDTMVGVSFNRGVSETASLPIDVSAPVPEPATMMLFGLGLLGLAGISRRKK